MLLTPELKSQMKEWMTLKRYSPELVSAQWSKDQIAGVSHETIYKWLFGIASIQTSEKIELLSTFTND